MPGVLYMNFGTMKLTDLSAELQSAIAKAPVRGASPIPFVSSAGVELIVRCDKAFPRNGHGHSHKDQIERQLYEEQMTVLARRYLRDLRREADVEMR